MRKIFIITIFILSFSSFAKAQAVASYLFLEVVDSNQKPVADATIETPLSNRIHEKSDKTGADGSAKFVSYVNRPDPTEFRIIKPDFYPFELFGLTNGVFRESEGYQHRRLKIELLKIPQNKDEKKLLGDEQFKRDFFLAVLKGNSAEVRRMLKSGINPNITTDNLRGVPVPKEIPAILYAAYNADIPTINEFLSAKIHLRNENSNIRNLLAYYISNLTTKAKSKEELSVFNAYVDKLLKAGASLNATDIRGQTLLKIAAQQNNVELVKKLIEKGVDVNAQMRYGSTALTDFISRNAYTKPTDQQIEIVKILLKSGADPNIFIEGYNGDCEFPLKTLTRSGRFELAKLLLSYKANPTLKCKNGRNALSDLFSNKIDSNYSEVANILIDAGLDVNNTSEYGRTPLMIGSSSGNFSIVKKLLDKSAQINAQDGQGYTPLMYLVSSLQVSISPDDKSIAELLLKSGANPNIVTKSDFSEDKTALAIAVCKGWYEPTKYQESVSDKMIELLISFKADANLTAKYGESPLICAAQNARLEATKMLIKAGANVNYKNSYGLTPLSAARHYQKVYPNRTEYYEEIIKLLREAGANEF